MSRIKLNIDTKTINKKIAKIIEQHQNELIFQRGKDVSDLIGCNEEIALDILLGKYNDNYELTINCNDFPEYMKFSIKDSMDKLKYAGLISNYQMFTTGDCNVVLTPNSLQYYNKRGNRVELFNEMSLADKELLRKIVEIDTNKGDICDFLKLKLENDEDNINRGIIGNLKSNGLLKVVWADNTIYSATLTQNGRTFFEREKKYLEGLKSNVTYINAQNNTVFTGNIINSKISIDNVTESIEKQIENNCSTEYEKKELMELLEEAKEIIDNYNQSNCLTKRRSFYKKLVKHLDNHGWFYAEIVNLFGQFVLTKISS